MPDDHPLQGEYFITKPTYICLRDNQVIVADLSGGKYLALDLFEAATLGGRIPGWPVAPGGENPSLVRALLERRLLTTDRTLGKPATAAAIGPATVSIRDRLLRAPPELRARHLYCFVLAVIVARVGMRALNLQWAINRIAARKAPNARRVGRADGTALRELTEIFERLRPFAFTNADSCLLHSLALIEFLARFEVFPSLVIGVRTGPFAAHSWVQYDEHLLSDTLFNVQGFTPIMVV